MKKLLALVLVSILIFSACKKSDEKQRFTDAVTEAACALFSAEDINDTEALAKQAKDIFKKYDFPIDDDKKMQEITSKYEKDTDVEAAVKSALEKCAGDKLKDIQTATPVVPTPADTTTPKTEDKTTTK